MWWVGGVVVRGAWLPQPSTRCITVQALHPNTHLFLPISLLCLLLYDSDDADGSGDADGSDGGRDDGNSDEDVLLTGRSSVVSYSIMRMLFLLLCKICCIAVFVDNCPFCQLPGIR